VAVVLLSSGGHSTEPAVPQGFHLVHARGPVSHATITECPPLRQRLVDVATGRERPAPLVLEVWWDAKSGFDRVVGRVAGRVGFDRASPRSAGYDWVALDVVTHRPVAKREFAHGRKFYEESYSVSATCRAKT
jgi:hypothetical protein